METFADIVEKVRKLKTDELDELELIIQKDRIEKARRKFLRDHKKALAEDKAGRLKFSSDIDFMKKQLGVE
jgi:hypothetical protein